MPYRAYITFSKMANLNQLWEPSRKQVFVLRRNKEEIKRLLEEHSIPNIRIKIGGKEWLPSMQKGLDYLLKFDAPIRWLSCLRYAFRDSKVIEETGSCNKKDRKGCCLWIFPDNHWGNQFFFTKAYFKALKLLPGDEGAKSSTSTWEWLRLVKFPMGKSRL